MSISRPSRSARWLALHSPSVNFPLNFIVSIPEDPAYLRAGLTESAGLASTERRLDIMTDTELGGATVIEFDQTETKKK
jgi:hypothetical protein